MACEKCWGDAFVRAMLFGGHQSDHYRTLLREREACPCSPAEAAGQFAGEDDDDE